MGTEARLSARSVAQGRRTRPSLLQHARGVRWSGADWLYNVIVIEEFWRAGVSGPGSAFLVHSDVVAPYLLAGGSEELKRHWLPKMVKGEAIAALGMTEPSGGSDVQNIRTSALRDGDDFIVNGQKIFISNGIKCDFVVLACKTDPSARAKGISLLLVEADRKGFNKGRNLEKIGLHSQDIAELFFADVRVPASNLIGELNGGFKVLMGNLVQERLAQAVRSTTVCETAIEWTVKYTRERKAFGHTIGGLSEHAIRAGRPRRQNYSGARVHRLVHQASHGRKPRSRERSQAQDDFHQLQGEVLDKCLQFFGGYGYMREYPIARAFVDARMTRIGGGSIEVMKQIIGRDLFKRFQ